MTITADTIHSQIFANIDRDMGAASEKIIYSSTSSKK